MAYLLKTLEKMDIKSISDSRSVKTFHAKD